MIFIWLKILILEDDGILLKWGFMIKVFLFGSMVGYEFVKEFNRVYLIFIFIIIMLLVS